MTRAAALFCAACLACPVAAQTKAEAPRPSTTLPLPVPSDEVRSDPATALGRLYGLIGRTAPASVVDWAARHVRAPAEPHAAGDPRWHEALRRVGIDEELDAAGYSAVSLG